jgi:hypothetical protein
MEQTMNSNMQPAKRGIKKSWIILGIVVVLVLWMFSGYNGLVEKQELATTELANVQTQYQRRADMMPQLAKIVKAYAKHEKETFAEVTKARAAVGQLKLDANNLTEASVTNEFGCYRTAKVNLIVSTTQVPAGFQFTLNACDEFISLSDPDFDGIDYFNLNPATTAILNLFPGNQNLTVTYYTSQANALAEINAITTLTNFRNTIPHSQTIWVRIDSSLNNDCIGLGPYVTLTVNPLPNFDLPTSKILCVQPTTGTGLLPIDATPTTPGSYSYVWTPAN